MQRQNFVGTVLENIGGNYPFFKHRYEMITTKIFK